MWKRGGVSNCKLSMNPRADGSLPVTGHISRSPWTRHRTPNAWPLTRTACPEKVFPNGINEISIKTPWIVSNVGWYRAQNTRQFYIYVLWSISFIRINYEISVTWQRDVNDARHISSVFTARAVILCYFRLLEALKSNVIVNRVSRLIKMVPYNTVLIGNKVT